MQPASFDVLSDDAYQERVWDTPQIGQSRQKPTFACSWPGCGRVYGKREHLQRHERGHAGDVKYECPVCKKRFVRRDVMTRHLSLHGSRVKVPRKVSCISCVSLKVRCDGQRGQTCSKCRTSGRTCVYRNTKEDSIPDQRVQDPEESFVAQDLPLDVLAAASESHLLASVEPGYHNINTNIQNPISLSITADTFPSVPVGSLFEFPMDPSESFFGWDMDESELDTLNIPPLGFIPTGDVQPGTYTASGAPEIRELSSMEPSELIRDAQPPDTPWPHVFRPSQQDNQLDLPPPVNQKARLGLQGPVIDGIEYSTRQEIISLIHTAHRPQWPLVDLSFFPSNETLTSCVNLYFRHFHETLPIIRRSTFRKTDAPPILLLTMAAIGAVYSHDGLSGLAIALNELARRVISHVRESDQRAMFDRVFIQALLLQSVFGLFCGSRMLYQHAEISRASLVTAARRMHLLRPSLSYVKELEKRNTSPSADELQRAYADDDRRRNLGWGIYLYDMQISSLLNIAPLLSISEINVPLPIDEETWNGSNPGERVSPEHVLQQSPSFRTVLDSLLSTEKLPGPLSSFGHCIVAHTLYRHRLMNDRLCTDASAFDTIFSRPAMPSDTLYRLAFPSTFKHNPQQLLDQLSVYCHGLSHMPNSLIVSVSALSHLGHMQFTWPAFLNNIKVAAGKSGTEESKADARSWLRARIAEDPLGSDFDDIHEWVKSGGPVCFQGLGDLSDLTSSKILSIFSERLENMPWGLSRRFKHVLMMLERE
ncbi:fungal-specific transcription factor domain-containing protein [Talaromyces proteolyticus]|uniref:Fungal-specific transcription factor domain-containing protein n=1 Tax=Talaromyces proteolyticus TaxID=1131652 RepID=A0AAD4KTS5_9EURO|nr:fungal-specific transcription factor domain-containing protein [Talaromyces proteolyticus]KAH8698650.1 fungal-specific transcription factor domain-containing protein [Talaromyces proteolyticus]